MEFACLHGKGFGELPYIGRRLASACQKTDLPPGNRHDVRTLVLHGIPALRKAAEFGGPDVLLRRHGRLGRIQGRASTRWRLSAYPRPGGPSTPNPPGGPPPDPAGCEGSGPGPARCPAPRADP